MKFVNRGELFARFSLGNFAITVFSDGYADMPTSRLHGATALDLLPVPLFGGQLRLSVNAFLVETPSGPLLIDTGSANVWRTTTGRFFEALTEARVAPESIETIALTHTHVDHVNGLVMPNGHETFIDATRIFVPENELSLFLAEERLRSTFSKLVAFSDGDKIAEGVKAVAAYGHEIGHSAFLIESGGERLLIWGDIIHVPTLQFSKPHITWEFDADQNQARQSRLHLLDWVAKEKIAIAGAHHDFPGIGHVASAASGYRFAAIA
jgi:glyoxylase-like metal-dependent hydrolase (beta-lactamase superfamily II)